MFFACFLKSLPEFLKLQKIQIPPSKISAQATVHNRYFYEVKFI